MSSITVTLESRISDLEAQLGGRVRNALHQGALTVEARAKALCPVDTGALRDSIAVNEISDREMEVVVGQPYGIFQEFGTVHMAPHPFITPAVEEVRPIWSAELWQGVVDLP